VKPGNARTAESPEQLETQSPPTIRTDPGLESQKHTNRKQGSKIALKHLFSGFPDLPDFSLKAPNKVPRWPYNNSFVVSLISLMPVSL
jgi:hypothetical protein